MRKITSLCFAALSVVFVSCGGSKEETLPLRPSDPNIVVVKVRENLDDLEVTVKPWRRRIKPGENIKWVLSDPHDLVIGDLEINNNGKTAGCAEFPPKVQQAQPVPDTVEYGPFQETAEGARCKYNIVLHTAEGDVIIDPEYRVRPGQP